MRKRALILIIAVLVIMSIAGLLIFGFEGGLGRGYGADQHNVRSLSLVLFVVPLILAVGLVGYIVTFPNIEEQNPQAKPDWISATKNEESALGAVLRVLDKDEKKVIEVLADAEDKTMLQKDIRWKTGFSRVKAHRVLYRLAKRGLITAEKYYNTNKITLAKWLTKEKPKNPYP